MSFSFNLYIQFNLQARYPSSHSKLTNSLRQATYNLITEIDAGRVTVDMSQYTGVSSRFNVKTVHFDEVCNGTVRKWPVILYDPYYMTHVAYF